MAGVRPDYQQYGIGRGLKLHQRAWALEHGYDEIRWTFDPLLRGNANFNLHKLGATFGSYLINFYGTMTDGINANGLPSDRVEAVWRLNEARVVALASANNQREAKEAKQATEARKATEVDHPALLERDEHGHPRIVGTADGKAVGYRVQLPQQLKALESDATLVAWRLALRATLQTAIRHRLLRGGLSRQTNQRTFCTKDSLRNRYAYLLHDPSSFV